MRAGHLRERIAIQQFTETQNAIGEPVKTWGTVASVWARIVALSGDEFFASGQRNAKVDHRIEIRTRAGVNAKMRVSHRNRIFRIEAVIPDERKRELHLMCEELVDEVVS